MALVTLTTMEELHANFMEWVVKVVEEHKPSNIKEFLIENLDNDTGCYYMMTDQIFSPNLLLDVIREVGYNPNYNEFTYYNKWTLSMYEKIKN